MLEQHSIFADRQSVRRASSINRLLFKNRAVLRNCPQIVLSKPNQVNLNAWITFNSTHNNLGDYLSLVVVENVCSLKGIDFYKEIKSTKHLYAIGSILPGYQDATVWGSGFGYDKPVNLISRCYNFFHRNYHRLDIRAIRGPETKRILEQMGIACPAIYGDPAVLMPLFYKPNNIETREDYIVIPHYSKLSSYKGMPNILGTFTKDYLSFIDTLLGAKLVISSSLHGIILAEAYGIPAVMLNDTPSEDITKYKDWYYSTGRTSFPIVNTISEALELGGTPIDYSVIEHMQTALLDAFPIDLWNE